MARAALRPIDLMTAEWRARSRSPDSRVAVARLAEAEETVAALGAADLGDLVAATRLAAGRLDREHAARVVRAMLRSQDVHPLIPRAILQAVIPGLVTTARRLSWGTEGDWQSRGAFLADAVAMAWQVIVEWSGQDRTYAVLDLLSAVRCRLRRQVLHQRSAQERVVLGVDLDLYPSPEWSSGTTALDELAGAIDGLAEVGTDPRDVAILYGNQVFGYSLGELAGMAGCSRKAVTDRRDRAMRVLCA